MNERIKELAAQSQKVVGHTDGGYTEIKALDQEKFAELIVKECIAICISNALDDDGGCAKAGFEIKEHFGIEE